MKVAIAFLALVAVAVAAPTRDPNDYRHEYDRLLVETSMEHFHKLEAALVVLNGQVVELEKTKNKDLKLQILREISLGIDFVDSAKVHLERELKRADLNLLEKFTFEATLATGQVVHRDLEALGKHVKSIGA